MRVRPLSQLLAVTAVSGAAVLALSTPAGAVTYPVSPAPTPSASPAGDSGAGGGGGGGGTGTDTGAGGGGGGGGTGTDGGGSLPTTGSNAVIPMAASGIALVLVGATVVVVARRRRSELDGTSFA